MVSQEGHYCISANTCHSHTSHYLTDTMAILHDRHISEVAHASSFVIQSLVVGDTIEKYRYLYGIDY